MLQQKNWHWEWYHSWVWHKWIEKNKSSHIKVKFWFRWNWKLRFRTIHVKILAHAKAHKFDEHATPTIQITILRLGLYYSLDKGQGRSVPHNKQWAHHEPVHQVPYFRDEDYRWSQRNSWTNYQARNWKDKSIVFLGVTGTWYGRSYRGEDG